MLISHINTFESTSDEKLAESTLARRSVARNEIVKLSGEIATEIDQRRKMKLARRLAFAGSSMAFAPSGIDLGAIDYGLSGLRLARRTGAKTEDLNRSFAWFCKLRLDAAGCSEISLIAESRKTVFVSGACILAIGLKRFGSFAEPLLGASALRPMNRGDFFLIETGNDGRYAIVLRLIEAPEPV